jgi:Flp pilus assembly protein TadG
MRSVSYKRRRQRGMAVVYTTITFSAICAISSLAVDFGRVSLDKFQLQAVSDAAARDGALGMSTSSSVAIANAQNVAKANSIEGKTVTLQSSDVVVGVWNTTTKTFTAGSSGANAVEVNAQLTNARGTAVPTVFASMLGFSSCSVHATSIAYITPTVVTTFNVPGLADPWLAGMPNGTTANFYSEFGDAAPNNSPTAITGLGMQADQSLQFSFNGTVSNWSGDNSFGCDGDPSYVSNNWWAAQNGNAEHGIGNVTAPIAAVIGVFLDDSQPDSTPAPTTALDFSTAASRDFASISPALKQPFFIGDGLRNDGVTPQNFVVPTGATRLYVGIMDFQQWSDNSGVMSTTVTNNGKVTMVK